MRINKDVDLMKKKCENSVRSLTNHRDTRGVVVSLQEGCHDAASAQTNKLSDVRL